MKSLFIILTSLITASFSLAQPAAAKKTANVLCDVRQWGNGQTHMNQKNISLVLVPGEDEDTPMYDAESISATIATPVGPVTVSQDAGNSLSVHYVLKLGNQSAAIIGEGKTEAKITVFLGPQRGDNNGLKVGCRLVSAMTLPSYPPAQEIVTTDELWDRYLSTARRLQRLIRN